MKEYFVVLVSIIFVGGMIVSVTPAGSFQKYMRFLCGLAVCGCVMFPLISGDIFKKIDPEDLVYILKSEEEGLGDYDEIYNLSLKNAGVENSEKHLKTLIIKELDANDSDIDVCLVTNDNSVEIYIERVEVIIYPSGVMLDPRKIQNIVYDVLECECIVIYE